MNIKLKKLHPEAVLPFRAREDDAGFDLTAIDDGQFNETGTCIKYRTGWAIELPKGYHVEIFPRGSVSKTDLMLANSIGLVDNGYRGELFIPFKFLPRFKSRLPIKELDDSDQLFEDPIFYKKGDRIAQLVFRKTAEELNTIEIVEELSNTDRGNGAFGSSDAVYITGWLGADPVCPNPVFGDNIRVPKDWLNATSGQKSAMGLKED